MCTVIFFFCLFLGRRQQWLQIDSSAMLGSNQFCQPLSVFHQSSYFSFINARKKFSSLQWVIPFLYVSKKMWVWGIFIFTTSVLWQNHALIILLLKLKSSVHHNLLVREVKKFSYLCIHLFLLQKTKSHISHPIERL